MSTSRNRTHTGSNKTRRKYIGDPEDPHFVPTSPIISRPSLTHEEEEELTRSCTLVLSGVPTSDDAEDDPLMKYITNHIATNPPKPTYQKEKSTFSESSIGTESKFSSKSQKVQRNDDDTATPSENSKRTTIDRTNTSTPSTVLSETLKRPSSTRHNTATQYEPKHARPPRVHTLPEEPESKTVPKELPVRVKSMTSLLNSQSIVGSKSSDTGASKARNIKISHVEFNKSLPSLPHIQATEAAEQQNGGLLRFFKGMRKRPKAAPTQHKNPVISTQTQRSESFPVPIPKKRSRFNLILLFDRGRQ